jgi:hypothetical protein
MKNHTFKAPEGFGLPENVGIDEEFEGLVSLKLDEDGNLTITAVEGIPLEDDMEEVETEEVKEAPMGERGFLASLESLPGGMV